MVAGSPLRDGKISQPQGCVRLTWPHPPSEFNPNVLYLAINFIFEDFFKKIMIFFLKLFFGLTFQSNEFSLGHFYITLVFHFFLFSLFSISDTASSLFITALFLSVFLFCFGFRNLEKGSFREIMENVSTIPFLLSRYLL